MDGILHSFRYAPHGVRFSALLGSIEAEVRQRARREVDLMKIRSLAKTVNDRGEYAEKEDFVWLFGRERSELQKLAVLLTANRESAQRSVAYAFHDCVTNGSVFRLWIRIWARRMVIRNAIIEAMEHTRAPLATTNEDTDVELTGLSEADFANLGTGYDSILALPKFERFVCPVLAIAGTSRRPQRYRGSPQLLSRSILFRNNA